MRVAGLKGLLLALLVVTAGFLGLGVWAAALPAGVPVLLLLLLLWALWLAQDGQRLPGAPDLLLLLLLVTGSVALLRAEAALPALYPGVVAALAAWDLSRFHRRLLGAGAVLDEARLLAAHLRRLALVSAAALAGLPLYLWLELPFDFERALLLGLLLLGGLWYLLRLEIGD